MESVNWKEIKAVIFDFDGTLYDFSHFARHLIISCPHEILRMREERKLRKVLKGSDFGSREKLRAYCEERTKRFSCKGTETFYNWFDGIYVPHMVEVLKKKYSVRPAVDEVFKKLTERGIKFSILSDYPLLKDRMAAIGLDSNSVSLAHGLFSSGEFGCVKPAPRPFLEIAESMGVKPEECLVVGDRDDTDGEGARCAGMKFVQIKTRKSRTDSGDHPVLEWSAFADSLLK